MRVSRSVRRVSLLLLVLLLAACPNVLMNDIQAKIAGDTAKDINSFVLTAAANAKVYLDVPGVIDEQAHTISLTVPKWVPLTGLVATFQFQGASVTVNGIIQHSGVTAQDFSQPLVYTVTPASGSPVQYTVTAVSGAQGLMGGVIQGTPLSLTGAVTTLAGAASPFGNPMGVVRVGGTIYVADAQYSVIWAVDTSGNATVYAGMLGQPGATNATGTSAQFDGPQGLATDGTSLYVADMFNDEIRQIDLTTAAVTTVAGASGTPGKTDGTGSSASFNGPEGLYYDSGSSQLYETDKFSKIVRTVNPSTKAVLTIISTGLTAPEGVVLYNTNLYVVDAGTNNAVYEYGPSPTYTPSGTFSSTGYSAPTGIIAYGTSLYVVDSGNHVIKQVNPTTGTASVYTGTAGQNGHVDTRSLSTLLFDTPNMVFEYSTTGPTTNTMYITEAGNADLRSISLGTTDIGTTLYGLPPGSSNGTGSTARFYSPRQMATNGRTVWLSDQLNDLVRNIDLASGYVGSMAGQVEVSKELDGTGSGAELNSPAGITTDGKALYVCDQAADTIRRIDIATGAVTTIAGSDGVYVHKDGTGTAATFMHPTGITTDGTNLYVCEQDDNDIRQIDLSTLKVTTIAGTPSLTGGDADGTGTAATFTGPSGITTDGTSLFVTEASTNKIRRIIISTGVVTTFAGPAQPPATQVGGYVNAPGVAGTDPGANARFRTPVGITTDGTSLFVADQFNDVIRKVDLASGTVTTVAGADPPAAPPPVIETAEETDNGTANAARFSWPIGITTDGTGLYVTDRIANTLRVIR